MLGIDNFGAALSLNYPSGDAEFRTGIGACATICLYIVTLIYFSQSLIIMYNRDGTQFTRALHEAYHDADFNITEADGFQIAVALTSAPIIADGSLKKSKVRPNDFFDVSVYVQGVEKDGSVNKITIPSRNCSDQELGLDPDAASEAKFYPIKPG